MTRDELTKLLADVSSKAAIEAVEGRVKELGLDKPAQKFAAYRGAASDLTDAELRALSGKEKSASFIKALFHKDASSLAKFKAMTEAVGSQGGFVVPEEFAAEVNRVVEDFGLVAKMARKFPMKSDTLNVPRLSATVTVTFPGEATAGTASQPVFEQVILASKTCVGLTPMSNELLEDANISVVDLLTELFAEAIAGKIDEMGLAGTGSPFTGILSDTGVTRVYAGNSSTSGKTTFTLAATPDYCRDLISNVKPWSLQGAAFIMHRTVWSLVQQTKASTSGEYFISAANPVMVPNGAQQGFPSAMAGTLWGYPVYLSDKMPTTTAVSTKFIIFGNLKHVWMGVRKEIGISISQDATVGGVSLYEANMSAVRVVNRWAVAVGLPTAFSALSTSAS